MSAARHTNQESPDGESRMQDQDLFAKRFGQWRVAQGESRRATAARLGVTEQTLLNWESGRAPSYDALARLVAASGVSGDYWLGVTDDPSRGRIRSTRRKAK
jgi:transcriptional regulator with XRE-family HTH domain